MTETPDVPTLEMPSTQLEEIVAELRAKPLTALSAPPLPMNLEQLFVPPSQSIMAEVASPLDCSLFEPNGRHSVPVAPTEYGRSLSTLVREDAGIPTAIKAAGRKSRPIAVSIESRRHLQALARERISREIAARPRLTGARARPRFSLRPFVLAAGAFVGMSIVAAFVFLGGR